MSSKKLNNDNTESESTSERKWIALLKEGEERGFDKIYELYFSRLSQFVYRYVHSKDIAEDLIHNVFLSLWKNRKNIQLRDSLRPYLYQAARNQAMKYMNRSKKDFVEDYPLGAIKDREQELELAKLDSRDRSEFQEKVIEAVDKLPDKRRQIYLLSREDGLTYKEISQVLSISIKTVETQISRTLRFLREHLSDYMPAIGLILASIFK